MDFTPKNTKTSHTGIQREYTTVSWPLWHQRYAPDMVRCLIYTKDDNKIFKEKTFNKTNEFTGSVTEWISTGGKIIILEWSIHSSSSAVEDSFLNETLPIDKSQRFQDGIVAIGLGRWMKSLLMQMIASPTHERDEVAGWFRQLTRFVADRTRSLSSSKWFDVIRQTIKENDRVEDILVIKLLQAVLGQKTTRLREFRWFETSMQRALKYNPGHTLSGNIISMVVWLYTDLLLVKNIPDITAMNQVFADLSCIASYTDLDIIQMLLDRVFPELSSYTIPILESIRNKKPWTSSCTITFSDGSSIQTTTAQDLPYGLRLHGGLLSGRGRGIFDMTTTEYNHYSPLQMSRPSINQTIKIKIYGSPMPSTTTSMHGPGIVFRGLTEYTKNGRAFIGINGISLAGGYGNGKGAPTTERPKPAFLLSSWQTKTERVLLCTITVTSRDYSVVSSGWSEALTMAFTPSDTVFGVFIKGFKDLEVAIEDHTIEPVKKYEGVAFKDLLAETPLQQLQKRVDTVSR